MARKGESIYKRKDGRWEARFLKETETGQRRLISVYAKTYSEVKNKRIEAIKLLSVNKLDSHSDSLLLSELLRRWLGYIGCQIKVSSYQKYEGMIRNHIQPRIGNLKVVKLTQLTLREFSNDLLMNGNLKKSGGLSIKSVNSILTLIGSALRWASEWTDIPLLKIPFLREPRSTPKILSRTEQMLLERYVDGNPTPYSTGMLFSLYTGMRLGEICALKWEDVTDDAVYVHRSMQRIKNENGRWEVVLVVPKTNNSCRLIPIPEPLKPYLHKNRRSEGYVFVQDNGHFIEPRLMQKKISVIFEKADISLRNFHALRHTFATRLIESGSDPKTVSELLGHSAVQITLNKYVHPSFDMKKNAIERICCLSEGF